MVRQMSGNATYRELCRDCDKTLEMSSLARWVGLSLLVLSTSLPAQTDKKVREIVIHSGWGALEHLNALR
jgi:hypothetical protein